MHTREGIDMSRTSFFKNKIPLKRDDAKAPLLEQQDKISQQHDYDRSLT